ncbi:MAG: TolC family outer membrane protein [Candidatus Endonucleobacter bathymodioli]|uniref:TolC family outer membrane protein n=1 Tax=Candidatus Endonucleibacter bathymodioli TaxID=539814 RepID=A0AA90NMH8_9GAMM|nr:TolC family outer membrane protein [Candidatus Endonucleobacter bathymodioli]
MITIKSMVDKASICILCCSATVHAITLEQSLFDTLQSSPDMAEAIQQYYAAKSDKNIAVGGFLPRLDLFADAGVEDIDRNNMKDTHRDRTSAKLRLSIPVFKGFANVNAHDRASAAMMSSYYKSMSQAEMIALNLTKCYIDVLKSTDVVVMSEENLVHHQRTYDLILKRANQGVSNQADLSQIKSRLARSRANMVSARSNYHNTKISYRQVTGVFPKQLNRPKVDSNYIPKSSEQVIELAFANHQVLRSSKCNVDAYTSASKEKSAHYYPNFDVVADMTWKDDVAGFRGREKEWRILLEMKWNLFAGGQESSAHKKALSQEEAGRMKLNSVMREVKGNAEASWTAYEYLKKEQIFLEEYVEQTAKTEKLYEQQFKAGKRSLLDLLDSQNELFQARQAYVEADYNYLYAQYRVVASMSYILDALNVNVMNGLREKDTETKDKTKTMTKTKAKTSTKATTKATI